MENGWHVLSWPEVGGGLSQGLLFCGRAGEGLANSASCFQSLASSAVPKRELPESKLRSAVIYLATCLFS